MNKQIVGWDIGGAHLKAALLTADGEILQVIQQACPLWRGISELDKALALILHAQGDGDCRHVITMTGELVDCFADREQGVKAIIQAMQNQLAGKELLVFAGRHGFLNPEQINADHYMAIASANWLASAELAAQLSHAALFVDIGSTTTDLLLLENQQVSALGYTDYQRLVSGELLYTGVVRTSVMAIAQRAQFKGQEMGLMAEHFATTADVYRVTGDLHEAHDQAETADGAEKTPLASARRLSRLTGYEFDAADWPLWLEFAQYLKARQKQLLTSACLQQMQRSISGLSLGLVGAGVGRFLLKEIAAEQGFAYQDFADLLKTQYTAGELDAADCAPAVAVAWLVVNHSV